MFRCAKRINVYLIRQLLGRALTSTDDHRRADLQAIEDSFGILGDVAAPQRGRGEREEHLDRMWQRAR